MLISIEFEFSLYRFGGCKQFRVSTYPLGPHIFLASSLR